MLRTSLQLGLVHGEDQFYIPVKARKNQNQRRQQHQKAKSDATENTAFSAKSKTATSEERNPQASSNSIAKPFSEPSPAPSNLDRFLKSTTPWVPALYFSKVQIICIFLCLFGYWEYIYKERKYKICSIRFSIVCLL